MLDTSTSLSLLTLMEIVGPIVLAAALIFGILQYRKRTRGMSIRTEETTRKLYRDAAEEERQEEARL
jgi:hypothetical protein